MSQLLRGFRIFARATALFALACLCAGQIRFEHLPQTTIDARIADLKRSNADRQKALVAMFTDAGCGEHLRLQPVARTKLQNVICVLPGEAADEVIVGAHFDHIEDRGMGAVDNWSGASMLPSLYQSLKSEKRRHTLVFIGFAEEEKGLWGSRDYVDRLSAAERDQIDAMINIDSVGVEPPEVWESHANKALVSWAAALAKLQHQKITAVNFERVGDADSTSFYDRKIPAITFHSLRQESLGIIHSQRDVLSAINHENLYATYKFLVGYVALVGAKADKSLRTK